MAVGCNPVDRKSVGQLGGAAKDGTQKGEAFPHRKIAGYDGAGIVQHVGGAAAFKVGDEVWWCGDLHRDGSLQQYQLVDSRLVSLKPRSLSFDEAASLPLTAITAWEALKERLNVQPGRTILITAGAGGVGSIATQLAHHWGLHVIASVGREETAAWAKAHGADLTVDHKRGIAASFRELSLPPVAYCFNTFSEALLNDIVPVMAPFGHICGINGDISAAQVPAVAACFGKALSLHYEYMFAKVSFGIDEQSVGDLLKEVAGLVDAGKLVHTMRTRYSWHDVAKAYGSLESRSAVGKIVMTVDENANTDGAS